MEKGKYAIIILAILGVAGVGFTLYKMTDIRIEAKDGVASGVTSKVFGDGMGKERKFLKDNKEELRKVLIQKAVIVEHLNYKIGTDFETSSEYLKEFDPKSMTKDGRTFKYIPLKAFSVIHPKNGVKPMLVYCYARLYLDEYDSVKVDIADSKVDYGDGN